MRIARWRVVVEFFQDYLIAFGRTFVASLPPFILFGLLSSPKGIFRIASMVGPMKFIATGASNTTQIGKERLVSGYGKLRLVRAPSGLQGTHKTLFPGKLWSGMVFVFACVKALSAKVDGFKIHFRVPHDPAAANQCRASACHAPHNNLRPGTLRGEYNQHRSAVMHVHRSRRASSGRLILILVKSTRRPLDRQLELPPRNFAKSIWPW